MSKMKMIPLLVMTAMMSQSATAGDNPEAVSQPPVESATPSSAGATDAAALAYAAQDIRLSDEERAEAIRALGTQPSQNGLVAVTRAVKDDSATIREAAIIGASPYQLEHRWRMLSPLLTDTEASVRLSAATAFAQDFPQLNEAQKELLNEPLHELVGQLSSMGDAESQLMLADVYRWTGDYQQAQSYYENLVDTMPMESQVWLGYADNYRAQNKNSEAIEVLDTAIKKLPNHANLHYSKSLALVRIDDKAAAATEMEQAANLANNNSYFWYLNGVLQEPLAIDKSTQSFEKAYALSGAPEHLYALCDIYVRHNNDYADDCMEALGKIAPPLVIEELNAKRQPKG